MRIDKIEIENFKGFKALTAEFAEGVNLFVGVNGSGKTSLLEAINVAVGGFFGSREQKMQRVIEFDEIRIEKGIRLANAVVKAISADFDTPWSRSIKRDTRTNDSRYIKPMSDYGKTIFESFENSGDRTIAPVIAYYSSQRLFRDSRQSGKQKYDPAAGRRNGYLQCLEENAIKTLLTDWLGKAVTKRATMHIMEIVFDDLVLANVEQAIRLTLSRFLNLPEDFALKIYQDPNFDNDVFLQFDTEQPLPIRYYSDGFRNLLYLVIDLMWRSSQLNPWMSFAEVQRNVFGIVTIDEIDLHLHPTWQARAIGLLQELFPKVQFFITTHSPTVVANFENGTLYTINEQAVTRVHEHYFGKEVNAILRDILGSKDRHVDTQNKIDRLLSLIQDDGQDNEVEALINELTAQLGKDDKDIQHALSLKYWKEVKNVDDAVH